MLARKRRRLPAEVSVSICADEDVGEYFNDNVFKDEAAPGALPKMDSLVLAAVRASGSMIVCLQLRRR